MKNVSTLCACSAVVRTERCSTWGTVREGNCSCPAWLQYRWSADLRCASSLSRLQTNSHDALLHGRCVANKGGRSLWLTIVTVDDPRRQSRKIG